MLRGSYRDDLTDREWKFIEKFIDKKRKSTRGRKEIHEKRKMLNAIFYLLRTGCSWCHLPHDFPS